jgi:hypothetical protein
VEQKMNSRLILAVGAFAFAFAGNAAAHHTHAHYETESVVIEGTVTEFDWRAPHSWVTMTVVNAETGQEEEWLLESRAPGSLMQNGWTQQSLKPGDRVSVTMRPLKSGGTGGLLRSVEFPDGTVLADD